MIKFTQATAAIILCAAVSGCSAGTFSASGSMTVPPLYPVNKLGELVIRGQVGDLDSIKLEDGGPCLSDEGYNDISDGSQVTITNEAGEVIALGTLSAGVQTLPYPMTYGDSKNGTSICAFSFEISDVPAGQKFYNVSMGNTSRGEVSFSEDELKAGIALNLGD